MYILPIVLNDHDFHQYFMRGKMSRFGQVHVTQNNLKLAFSYNYSKILDFFENNILPLEYIITKTGVVL